MDLCVRSSIDMCLLPFMFQTFNQVVSKNSWIAMFKSFLNKSHEVRVLGPLLLRSFHSTALLLEPPDGMLSSPMGIGQGAQPLSHWLWFPAINPFVDGTFWRFFRNDIATYTKHQVAQSCCDEIFIFRSWRWSYAFARPVRAWTGQNIEKSVIAGNTASHSEASWWLKLLRMYLSFVQAADQ